MSISDRERKLLLAAGLVIAAFVIAFVIVPRLGGGGTSMAASHEDSLAGLHQDVKRKEQLASDLEAKKKRLSVKIPAGSADEQVQGFVKAIETVVGKAQANLTGFQPKSVTPGRSRGRTAGSKVSYELNFTIGHVNLVNFIKALEDEGMPYVIESIDLKNDGNPGNLIVAMEISFYILEPMTDEKKA